MFERRSNYAKNAFQKMFGDGSEGFTFGGKKGKEAINLALEVFRKTNEAEWDRATLSAYYLYHTKYKISKQKIFFPYLYGRTSEEYLKVFPHVKTDASGLTLKFLKGLAPIHSSIQISEKCLYTWIFPTIGLETFETKNPIESPEAFAYPWKNVTLAHLTTVHKMNDREHLIDLAERENMSWFDFMDYVLNHILSVNEEAGEEIYRFVFKGQAFIPYILDTRSVKIYEKVNAGKSISKYSHVVEWKTIPKSKDEKGKK
jgi:hypothetical protein